MLRATHSHLPPHTKDTPMNQDDISNLLTADELLHMAIEASNRERYDLSIAYLKQAMAKPELIPHTGGVSIWQRAFGLRYDVPR